LEAGFPERMHVSDFEQILRKQYPMLQLGKGSVIAFCYRNKIGTVDPQNKSRRILSREDMVRVDRVAARTADLFHSGDFLTATQLGKAIKPDRNDEAAKGATLSALKDRSAKVKNPKTGKTEIMPYKIPFIRIEPGTTIGADYSGYVFPKHVSREFPSIFNPNTLPNRPVPETGDRKKRDLRIRKTGQTMKEISAEADAKKLEHELRMRFNAGTRGAKKRNAWLERELSKAEKEMGKESRQKQIERKRSAKKTARTAEEPRPRIITRARTPAMPRKSIAAKAQAPKGRRTEKEAAAKERHLEPQTQVQETAIQEQPKAKPPALTRKQAEAEAGKLFEETKRIVSDPKLQTIENLRSFMKRINALEKAGFRNFDLIAAKAAVRDFARYAKREEPKLTPDGHPRQRPETE